MVGDPRAADQRPLTDGPWYDAEPAWSADRTMIAFSSDRGGEGARNIYVMNGDGTGIRRLTRGLARDVKPRWSPDGTRIAFASDRGGRPGVWLVNRDGTGMHRAGDGYAPLWSPDGRWIAYPRWCVAVIYPYGGCGIAIQAADSSRSCDAPGRPDTLRWAADASRLLVFLPPIEWGAVAPNCRLLESSEDTDRLAPSGWSDPDLPPSCTMDGTIGNRLILGTTDDDVICAGLGDDIVDAGDGHDVLYGSDGNDTLTGGPGRDWLFGANGNDTIQTRDGNPDTVHCGPGNDTVNADADDAVSSDCEHARVLDGGRDPPRL